MYGFYTPVLLLQAFCVYHAYRNNAEQRWYWLIVLIPLVGCIMYLFHSFNNREVIESGRESLNETVVSNHRIEQLEKAHNFSDTITNKINLADAYVDVGRYKEGILLYSSCLHGFMADDVPTRMKLLYAYFMDDNYVETVRLGDELEAEKTFRDSDERLAYAWAAYHQGDVVKSERIFTDMDRSFTNYLPRFEFCKFLVQTDRSVAAKEKLSELLHEFERMQDSERRQKRPIQRDIRAFYENLASPA